MLAVCGSASQVPWLTARPAANAAGCTVSGPKVVKPPAVLEPDCAISLRFQYAEETCRGRYRPVTTNRTYPW